MHALRTSAVWRADLSRQRQNLSDGNQNFAVCHRRFLIFSKVMPVQVGASLTRLVPNMRETVCLPKCI